MVLGQDNKMIVLKSNGSEIVQSSYIYFHYFIAFLFAQYCEYLYQPTGAES